MQYPYSISCSCLNIVSCVEVETRSSRAKKGIILPLPDSFWRFCETKQDQYSCVEKKRLKNKRFRAVFLDPWSLLCVSFQFVGLIFSEFKVKDALSCLTFCDRVHYAVHAMLQAMILEWVAAAAAKSLQSCPTLCDPIDGSPPGPAIPGIL